MYQENSGNPIGLLAMLLLFGAVYFYFCFAQFRLAQRLGRSQNAWWSYIPILQLVLLVEMAQKPMIWLLWCFIPLVNIVAFAILWMEVAKGVNKSPALGILTLIPLINFVTIGMLAFGGSPAQNPFPPKSPSQTREPERVA